jgi:alkanesulfonate monooxygenase SsuD/methylene tetrahydromethanopterin reductase-like flavin-dependent oxidoreductase (luciferase family)
MWDRALGLELYEQRMRYIQRIDELGFDGLIFTEHHYGPNGGLTPSPAIMMSAATQVTEQIKLVSMGIILSLHAHPVRVAEELAMLDNLSRGRVVAGFITGNNQALYAYGIHPAKGRQMQQEAYDLVVKAWTEENPFEWHGEFYDYDCVSILPRCLQVPHPPVWTAAGSAESIEWAAQHRVGLISSGTNETARETLDYYCRYARDECDWEPTHLDRGLSREIYIGPTMARVREVVEEVILRDRADAYSEQTFEIPKMEEFARERYTQRSYEYRTIQAGSRRDRAGRSLEEMQRNGQYLVGDPDSITEQILRQRKECEADVIVIRPEMSALSLEEVGDSMELFAREVLPVVQTA